MERESKVGIRLLRHRDHKAFRRAVATYRSEMGYSEESDPSPDFVSQVLREGNGHFLVAVKSNQIVGFAFYMKSGTLCAVRKTIQVLDFWVEKSHRKTGIGSGLMQDLERRLAKKGVYSLYLTALPSNKPGIRFFKKHSWFSKPVTYFVKPY